MSEFERLCIRVDKVYDWITHQAEKEFNFSPDDIEFFEDFMTPLDPVNPCEFFGPATDITVHCELVGDIFCEETGDRQDVFVEEFDTVLQLVKIIKNGEFRILLSDNNNNNVLSSEPIPFFKVEKFLLCAPEGTDVICHVYDFDCDGSIVCNGDGTDFSLEVILLVCQSIQVETEVKVELEGKICKPRPEIILPISPIKECPEIAFPPQCPNVFPQVKHQKTKQLKH
ncbi:BMQ_0737 family morphogenetic spore coat protein [Bacillus solitudinis]|uniref:hypothetical protein n=1 Tax=Bacillus solitudinis TaxID=2014074 RepID=UPI000C24EDAA|nr:hypothetical protein [Bacillus solitudinis]